MFAAAVNNHKPIVESLVATHKCNVNLLSSENTVPLYHAVQKGRTKIANWLVTKGGATLFETVPRNVTFEPISIYNATTSGNPIRHTRTCCSIMPKTCTHSPTTTAA